MDIIGINPAPGYHESNFKWVQFRVGAIQSEPMVPNFRIKLIQIKWVRMDLSQWLENIAEMYFLKLSTSNKINLKTLMNIFDSDLVW